MGWRVEDKKSITRFLVMREKNSLVVQRRKIIFILLAHTAWKVEWHLWEKENTLKKRVILI